MRCAKGEIVKILFNAHLLNLGESYRATGVSNYTERLLVALSEIDSANFYTLSVGNEAKDTARILHLGANFQTIASRLPTHKPPVRIAYEQTVLPLLSLSHDVVFCPVNVVPLLCRSRRVLTIHDLAFLKFGDKHAASKRNYLTVMTRLSARRADAIITDAECTKQDVIELLGVSADKITVIPLAAGAQYTDLRDTEQGRAEIEALRAKYSLPERFFLYVGTLEPRKNIPALLRGYAEFLKQAGNDAPSLVIAGPNGWLYDEIFALTATLNLGNRVIFPGFVPRNEMVQWYCAALGFVYLSLFEGFGFPPLEAMACGTPVIVNDASSLPEVVGDAGLRVRAENPQEVAEALSRLASSPEFCERLRQSGKQQAARFSWQRTAEQTLDVIRSVIR